MAKDMQQEKNRHSQTLPTIFGAGFFNSHEKFGNIKVTPDRPVLRYEIEFFPKAGGTLFVDGRRYDIHPGMVLCARPGQVRHSLLPFSSVFLKLDNVSGMLADTLNSIPECTDTVRMEEYVALVRKVALYYESDDDKKHLHAYSALLEIIAMLGEETALPMESGEGLTDKHRQAVSAAIAYISTHFREACPLQALSEVADFSPVYFHRIFKSLTGQTPYECLNRRRMDEARRLLLTRECPLSEVAERCGFCSSSYFSAAFRRTYGLTPGAFRERESSKYLDV